MIIAAAHTMDEDRPVIEEAIKLGEAFGQEVVILHVISIREFRDVEQAVVDQTGRTVEVEAIRREASATAEEFATAFDANLKAEGLVGTPAEEILKYAKNQDADYIIVGGRRRTSIGKVLFGSITQSILVSSEIPVLTIMQE